MEISDLYRSLKEAYTSENLGRITGGIIELFRGHQYDALRYIQRVVHEYTPCDEEKINRLFSKLIMIYHPDRLNQNRSRMEAAYHRGDFEELFTMSHILHVQNLEPETATVSEILTDEDLTEEFGWEEEPDGFSYFMHHEEAEEQEDPFEFTERTFLAALKRRVYGNLNVDFPMYLLEDLEEIEMADYDIGSLEGVESCRMVRAIDLSNNNLTDLTGLQELHQIERLYLSNNHIGMIDPLSNLLVLQVLDISYNDVDDLSPLFDLSHLSYVNAVGNRIPEWQMETLQLKGITVVC